MARIALAACFILLVGLAEEELVDAQDVARLQSGVVKITAKPSSGTTNVGTGLIVRLEANAAYIVTAAHVVAGDVQPSVEFFTKRNMPVTSEVLGLEGGDEVRGLALVVVRGTENLPKGITALSFGRAARLTAGEDIVVIGFPRNAGPWAVIKGNFSSRKGREIYFSPSIDSGHSGGPIFQGGKVVAVVGAGNQTISLGITVRSVEDYLEGYGIMAQENAEVPTTPPETVVKRKVADILLKKYPVTDPEIRRPPPRFISYWIQMINEARLERIKPDLQAVIQRMGRLQVGGPPMKELTAEALFTMRCLESEGYVRIKGPVPWREGLRPDGDNLEFEFLPEKLDEFLVAL
ncbi:MAG: serine protease [Nitrospirota bacterium]